LQLHKQTLEEHPKLEQLCSLQKLGAIPQIDVVPDPATGQWHFVCMQADIF
jgi:hypothetical protein